MRILIYAHDTFGLGHFRRSVRVATAARRARPDANVLIVTGAATPALFHLPDGCDLLKLPTATALPTTGAHESPLGIDEQTLFKLRSEIILAAVRGYEPDVILVDFSPKGVRDELLPTLEHVRRHRSARVLFMMRDIVDDPERVIEKWARRGYADCLRDYYERILIFGDRKLYDVVALYRLDSRLAGMSEYLGYLVEKESTQPPIRRREHVLVAVGGGRDGAAPMERVLLSTTRRTLAICGPLMPDADVLALGRRAPATRFRRETEDLPALMRTSWATVAMAGYNTVCELLATRSPAVLVPRVHPDSEQLIRARLFSRLGLFSLLPPAEIGPRTLPAALQEARALQKSARQTLGDLDLNGLSNVGRTLLQ